MLSISTEEHLRRLAIWASSSACVSRLRVSIAPAACSNLRTRDLHRQCVPGRLRLHHLHRQCVLGRLLLQLRPRRVHALLEPTHDGLGHGGHGHVFLEALGLG